MLKRRLISPDEEDVDFLSDGVIQAKLEQTQSQNTASIGDGKNKASCYVMVSMWC